MNKVFKWIMPCFVLIFLGMSTITSHAAVFSIVPQTALPTSVPQGGSVKAYYAVTNTTGSFHSGNYVKYLPPNVAQVTVDGTVPNLCGVTFPLAANASCTLELNITGAVNGSNPNPKEHLFVCLGGCTTCCAGTSFPLNVIVSTVPSTYTIGGTVSGLTAAGLVLQNNGADNLAVTNGAASFTFSTAVASGGSYNITVLSQPPGFTCRVNNGVGSNISANVTNINVVCLTSYAYVTQFNAPVIMVCGIDGSGNLIGSSCVDALSGLTTSDAPEGITISNDGSTAYITGGEGTGSTDAYQCTIDHLTGKFSTPCTSTAPTAGGTPYDNTYGFLALNSANNLAYLGDVGRVIACPISGSSIQASCQDTGATISANDPLVGVALSPDNNVLYIGEYNYPIVDTCNTSSIPFAPCGQKTGGGGFTFSAPTGVVVNKLNTIVYIADGNNAQVYGCDTTSPILASTFNSCFEAAATPLPIYPWGITLNADNSIAYVVDGFGTQVYVCHINPAGGTFTSCSPTTGFLFSGPLDIAIS